MTFSLIAVCPDTHMTGTIVTSSSICVASRCSNVRDGVGAAQSQNITDPLLGTRMLDLVEAGASAKEALATVIQETPNVEWRQLGVIDSKGNTACYSGNQSLGIYATAEGKNCAAMGNMLDNSNLPRAMVSAFEQAGGSFPERLLTALEAGLAAGGEAGPIHSAGIKVAANSGWPIVDLRVDWDDTPDHAISQLRYIWEEYKPQMQAYITRAVDPANSESYGVPGDE